MPSSLGEQPLTARADHQLAEQLLRQRSSRKIVLTSLLSD